MKKYYQVFISSVSNEFREVRPKIIESIMCTNKFFPVAMEYMTAYDDTIHLLYSYMQNSDIYVLILGNSLGTKIEKTKGLELLCKEFAEVKHSLEQYMSDAKITNMSDITFTELEYVFADALKIKKGIFIRKDAEEKCESENSEVKRLYNAFRKDKTYKSWNNQNDLIDKIRNAIGNFSDELQDSTAGWIRETESKIYQSAKSAAIVDISLDGRLEHNKFIKQLNKAKKLKVIYTTGARFFDNYVEELSNFVANGGCINFLCSKPFSSFLKDVQKIEELYLKDSRESIHKEYENCISAFKQIKNQAISINKDLNCEMGTIMFGFTSTLFRSSILLCETDNADDNWGMLTVTLPPYKSKDTVSFELSDVNHNNNNNILFKRALGHFNTIWELAETRNEIYDIENPPHFSENSVLINENNNIKQYWKSKERESLINMRSRYTSKDILIEVAAQHPLENGLYPGKEFSKRLDEAARIYFEKISEGFHVKVYVPDSIHLDEDRIADDVSLSSAGCEYLKNLGIPSDCLYGDDLNESFKEKRYFSGVYNTADECFIAAQFFNSNANFGKLISICSPNQLMRKTLFYLEHSIIPEIITVPMNKLSHNFLYELLTATPYVLFKDHDWQLPDSTEALRTRRERDPMWTE